MILKTLDSRNKILFFSAEDQNIDFELDFI